MFPSKRMRSWSRLVIRDRRRVRDTESWLQSPGPGQSWVLTLVRVSLRSSVDVWLSPSAHYLQELPHSPWHTLVNSFTHVIWMLPLPFSAPTPPPGHVSCDTRHVSARADSEAGAADQWREEDRARDDGGHEGWRGHGRHGDPPRPRVQAPRPRLLRQVQTGLQVLLPGGDTLQVGPPRHHWYSSETLQGWSEEAEGQDVHPRWQVWHCEHLCQLPGAAT